MIYAVVDTNVFVSAMLTHHSDSATVILYRKLLNGEMIPLYNKEILAEYKEVLSRPRFHVDLRKVDDILRAIRTYGILSERVSYLEAMPDETDRVFYEVTLSHEDAYLVTGNQRHFPQDPIVVTPAQMLEILRLHA